ncbi:minor tail protein [Arthrobacter phage RedFox]|nr:minor tail protein [Arthrobacter phage RedFox]
MAIQTFNKAQVPVGSDPYALTADLKKMAETLNVVIPVAGAAERDALPAVRGMRVARLDQPGSPTNTYDDQTSSWLEPYKNLGTAPSFTNWTISGEFYGIPLGDKMQVNGTGILARTAGGTINIPGGSVAYTQIGKVIPDGALSANGIGVYALSWTAYNSGNGANNLFECYLDVVTGMLSLRGVSATTAFVQGSQINFPSLTYMKPAS